MKEQPDRIFFYDSDGDKIAESEEHRVWPRGADVAYYVCLLTDGTYKLRQPTDPPEFEFPTEWQ